MSFQLSPELDRNKVFLIKRSELEGRLDPVFYSADLNRFNSGKYENTKIGYLAKKIISGVGAGKQDQTTEKDGIIQIRPTNINANGELKYDRNIFLPFDSNFEKISINDVLFNNTNSQTLVGKTSILKESKNLFFSNHITKITVDKSKIIPDYLAILLNIYQRNKIFFAICTNWNNQSGIGLDLLKSLKIPIPPKEIQAQIIAKMDAAYTAKKQKEAEAKRLLDSIDAYLLGELGIELPEQEENTIQSRMFTRRLSEVSGGRYDSNFFKPYYTNITDYIKTVSHKKLGHIIKFSSESWNQKDIFANTFPYIEIGEIDLPFGEIKNISQVNVDEAPSRAKMIVRGGDIIISTTRPSRGAIVKIDDTDDIFIASTGFSVIREVTQSDINPMYLYYILRQFISLRQMEQRSSGGNYPAITQEELSSIIIPTPVFNKQTKIANHITSIRNQAKQLQQQAKADLAQAKKEVEAIILGEDK